MHTMLVITYIGCRRRPRLTSRAGRLFVGYAVPGPLFICEVAPLTAQAVAEIPDGIVIIGVPQPCGVAATGEHIPAAERERYCHHRIVVDERAHLLAGLGIP